MNGDESDKLDQISQDVRETRTHVKVVDERTQQMQARIDRLDEAVTGDVTGNKEDINVLQRKVKRNTTLIGTVTGGIGFIGIWLADKLTRLF